MRHPQLKANGRWCQKFWEGGKLRQRSFRTRREAEAFGKLLAAAEADKEHFEEMLAAGRAVGVNLPAERPGGMSFEELVRRWRESHLTSELRAATLKDYEHSLARLLAAFRGRLRNETVRGIAVEQLARVERAIARAEARAPEKRSEQEQALLARAEELREAARRTGPRAAGKMIGCAKTLWKFACARKLATFNPTDGVRKPKAARKPDSTDAVIDSNILTPAEYERLLAAAPAEHRCAVQFLFSTGVRLGELRGLAWSDIDFDGTRVLVRRQRSGLTGELTQPKTEAGTRWIDLPGELVTELKNVEAARGRQPVAVRVRRAQTGAPESGTERCATPDCAASAFTTPATLTLPGCWRPGRTSWRSPAGWATPTRPSRSASTPTLCSGGRARA